MLVACNLRRRLTRVAVVIVLGALASGCATVQGGPDRLYTPSQEVAMAQASLPNIEALYAAATTESDRVFYRNEYIARRMYIIDVEYSEYEAALTSERQKFGFFTATAAEGFSIASTLTTPVRSAQILAGLASGLGAARGFYDSEIVIAKTLQIAQGHMQAKRDDVAKRIILQRTASTIVYPLSAAMHDLEDLYRAGTLTTGLIEASKAAGDEAQRAAEEKEAVTVNFTPLTDLTKRILAFVRASAANRRLVRQWIEQFAQGMPLAFFLRSSNVALQQRMIERLQIP
jgi:hypothetical protein